MILYNGDKEIELLVNDNSYSYEAIMGEDTLTLYLSHPGYLDVPVGSWCDFQGKRYSLKKDSNFKKNGERNYEYTLVLETAKADMQLWKVRNTVDNRIKFSYTAKPHEHLELLVKNLNSRSSGWKVGECIEGTEKTVNYNHTYVLDGLSQLAQAYETEWQITEAVIDGVHTKTIHLRKVEYNKEAPLKLSYGKGNGFKVGVGRESGEIPPEIILVETTDKNIDYSRYGTKELLLPKNRTLVYEGRTYKTDEAGTCVMRDGKSLTTAKEDSLDCTEIYPSRIGTVSEVIPVDASKSFYDFIDKDIPGTLNFEECLIEGEKMTVIFQSGMLSGKEFDVKYYHESKGDKKARRFEIVPQEIDGITMPDDDVWMPKVGDRYVVFGIQLPEAYICDNGTKTGASWDVFREAAKYLYEHEDKQFTFTGILDGIWAKKRWLQMGGKIVLGGFVNFFDTQFHPDGSLIRMTGIKRYVNNPFSPEIELSNSPVGTSITSDLNKIETNEVVVDDKHKDVLQFTKRRFRDAKETMSMLENALLNFSGAINPVAVATMQMLVGDESLQFRFVNSKTNPVRVPHNITYANGILTTPAGIIQHMTLGIKEVSPKHEYMFWDMAQIPLSPENADAKYYLYAKCSKSNQSGTFLLSEAAISLEQIDGYYHLLVGVLNSEYEGDRSFVPLYGFTEILPGQITTDVIRSADGNTYFDLLGNEIGGRIKFVDGLLSGLVGIGNQNGINAGISGEGNSGMDVRIWAGTNEGNRNNAPFRVLHNGKMIGTDVDLKGIVNATSGSVGGFAIANGRIGAEATEQGSDGSLSIYRDFIRVGGSDGSVMIGNNVVPSTAGGAFSAAARITNKKVNTSSGFGYDTSNYGLFIDVAGGTQNYGLSSNAPLKAPAFINTQIGYITFGTGGYSIDFSRYSLFVVKAVQNTKVNLPSESSVAKMFSLGYSLPNGFGFAFTFSTDLGSSRITINLYHNDGALGDVSMESGDSMRILCLKSNGSFRYQILNYGS